MVKKAHPLAARIKKLMQKDEDVGKIAQATPLLIGKQAQHGSASCLHYPDENGFRPAARAMEVMLDRVCRKSAELVQARGGKTLTPSHM
jgi:hypothetical protein